jgi:hypothetical protein
MLDFLGKSSKRAQLDKIISTRIFTFPSWATEAIIVVVGGGGGGGCQGSPGWDGGGGGGSGGATVRRITVTGGAQVSCTIGAGGGPNLYTYGQNGNNSAFGAIVAVGGGGGGGAGEFDPNNGRNGATGGGGRAYYGRGKPGLAVGNASTNWEYQGYDGGTGAYDDGKNGGGGGAGSKGFSTGELQNRAVFCSGGDGTDYSLGIYADFNAFGFSYNTGFVGGGGGAGGGFNDWTNTYISGGPGGGGRGGYGGDQARGGASTTGVSGTPNTGGGGGGAGGYYPGNTAVGGSGGSGVIWVLSFTTAAGVYRVDPPSRPLGAGELITTYCSGFNLYGTYYNGAGGTYDSLIEVNSPSCGYFEPPPPPDAG